MATFLPNVSEKRRVVNAFVPSATRCYTNAVGIVFAMLMGINPGRR
jgi:hypothetical protein